MLCLTKIEKKSLLTFKQPNLEQRSELRNANNSANLKLCIFESALGFIIRGIIQFFFRGNELTFYRFVMKKPFLTRNTGPEILLPLMYCYWHSFRSWSILGCGKNPSRNPFILSTFSLTNVQTVQPMYLHDIQYVHVMTWSWRTNVVYDQYCAIMLTFEATKLQSWKVYNS